MSDLYTICCKTFFLTPPHTNKSLALYFYGLACKDSADMNCTSVKYLINNILSNVKKHIVVPEKSKHRLIGM